MHKYRHVVANEGLLTTEHHVQDYACRPDVYLFIILTLLKDFWRRKSNRPRLRHHLEWLRLVLIDERNIEIHDEKLTILVDQEILRLYVSMHNLLRMKVCYTFDDLLEKKLRIVFCVTAFRLLGNQI